MQTSKINKKFVSLIDDRGKKIYIAIFFRLFFFYFVFYIHKCICICVNKICSDLQCKNFQVVNLTLQMHSKLICNCYALDFYVVKATAEGGKAQA